SENETLRTIHSLRTIHGNFSSQDIPDKQLQQILQASIQAPNASALQSYSIIVIKDREKMKDICGYQGSVVLLYCVDYNRLKASAQSLGYDYHPEGMMRFITGSTSTILAVQTAVIAAKALGIDSLVTNGIHRGDMLRIWYILDLPKKHCYPLIALVLGYADHEPFYHKGRLDGAGVIHQEKYHQLTPEEIEEITQQYDNQDLHLGLIDNWDKDHKHYLDWLFTKWLGVGAKPMEKEGQAYILLKRSDFVDLQKG
ncbi:MAG: nitroreductase family protein, partial [bacterium]